MAKSKITVELTLKDGSKLVLDKTKIKNIESLSQTNSDASTIFYGVLASSGRLEILDYDGTIKKYINEGIIDIGNIIVKVYINKKLIQQHISTNNSYNNENKILTLDLSNTIMRLNDINYARPFISNKIQTTKSSYAYPEIVTLYHIAIDLFNSIGYYINEENEDILFGEQVLLNSNTIGKIRDLFKSITIDFPYISKDSVFNNINKICTVAQVYLILDENGFLKFISARPLKTKKNTIFIPKNKQYNVFTHELILNNSYDKVISSVNLFEKKRDTIYSSNDLTVSKDKNYIGNNQGINDSIYDVYGGISDNNYWFQFNYSMNIKDTDKIVDVRANSDAGIAVRVTANRDIYITEGDAINIEKETQSDTKNISLTNYYSGNYIPYHEIYLKNDELVDAFSFISYLGGENDELLEIRGQVNWNDYSVSVGTALKPTQYRDYYITDLVFNINAYTYSMKSKDVYYGEGENFFELSSNELMQLNESSANPIVDNIANNILSDYYNGISSGKITVACDDYYDKANKKIVDLSSGQLIKTGDFVEIEGNDKQWVVTGRNLRKTGTAYIDLEVMEVKPVYSINSDIHKCNVVLTRVSSLNPNATIGDIDINSVIYIGDVLKFNVELDTTYSGIELQSLKITSSETGELVNYINNSEYTVKGYVDFKAIAYSWETVLETNVSSLLEYSIVEQNSKFNYINDNIIKDRKVRITGKPLLYGYGYYIDKNIYYNGFESDFGVSEIYITDSATDSGNVVGKIKFALYEPKEDGKLPYMNYSSLGSTAYLGRIQQFKIEQFK